ncbi:MAG: hypothetical protein II882_02400 [Lachnospiraceae bacterium]|nr:hypothetical protein [Lachnospiraceae bacterium]
MKTRYENVEIRERAKASGVAQWEIAECLGIHEAVLSRKLRHELSDDEKAKIFEIIDQIKERRE